MSRPDVSLSAGTAGSGAVTGSLQCEVNCFLNTDESSNGRAGLEVLQEQKPAAFQPAGARGTASSHFSSHWESQGCGKEKERSFIMEVSVPGMHDYTGGEHVRNPSALFLFHC